MYARKGHEGYWLGEDAFMHMELLLDQFDEAVKSYEAVLVIKPDLAEIHNNLGVILNKLNQKDAALKSLERAVAIKPESTCLSP